jgi:hypothetical protein
MGLLDKLQLVEKDDAEFSEEFEHQFEQDPEPGERPAARKPKAAARPAPGATSKAALAKLSKQVAEDLATVIEVGAAVWGMSDECCAPELEAQARPIADALVGILARNPRVLMALANSDMAVMGVQTIALGRAVAPVAKKVYRNHISRAADDGGQEGEHQHGNPNGVQLGAFPAFSGIPRGGKAANAA